VIVCSCHAVSDRTLRDAATSGLSLRDVRAVTRAGTGCGACHDAIAEIVTGRRPCRPDACPGCPKRSAP
jgi:bacterioferritin-associated ferredoxin